MDLLEPQATQFQHHSFDLGHETGLTITAVPCDTTDYERNVFFVNKSLGHMVLRAHKLSVFNTKQLVILPKRHKFNFHLVSWMLRTVRN